MSGTTNILTLRPATDEDKEFLVELFASTRAAELQMLAWNPAQAEMFINLQYNAQSQSYSLSYPSAENNLIFYDGQPIGRMLVDRAGDVIHLVDIAILPEYRGRGLGANLISGLLDEAKTQGSSVALSVFNTNPAIHLYERLGFQKVGEESLYWQMRWLPEPVLSKNSIQSEKDD